MRKIILSAILIFIFTTVSYAAPCYGTRLPGKNKFTAGLQDYRIFKRYLEDNYGKLRSQQQFLNVSYGIFDWLSIDLKGGAGDIKQRPTDASEIKYSYGFAGGYGLRLRLYDNHNIKAVFGFQHISVHPKHTHVDGVKNSAILDDWQTSLLGSYDFKFFTPYIGTRWSRVDYIHKWGDDRKREMSDFGKQWGLILGFDVPITQKIYLNVEGQMFDSEAVACSLNYQF